MSYQIFSVRHNSIPVVHGVMGCDQKSFKLVWGCHYHLSGFLAIRNLPRVSRKLLLSANDKDDNKRSPGIYLTTEENPGNPQLGIHLVKPVRPVIASNGIPYLQLRSGGSHSRSGREKDEKKERTE